MTATLLLSAILATPPQAPPLRATLPQAPPLVAVAKPAAVTPYRDAPGTHRHRCPIDGTVWAHSPGGSHACPTCGRESSETRKHYTGPAAPTPAPAKPKRVSKNGRWYDLYADGRLVECAT